MINRIEKKILVIFLEIVFISSFTTSSARFSEFDAGNVVLSRINLLARNIKEIALANYFIKVTARPSFTRLRVITSELIEFIKYENRKYVRKIQLYLLLI